MDHPSHRRRRAPRWPFHCPGDRRPPHHGASRRRARHPRRRRRRARRRARWGECGPGRGRSARRARGSGGAAPQAHPVRGHRRRGRGPTVLPDRSGHRRRRTPRSARLHPHARAHRDPRPPAHLRHRRRVPRLRPSRDRPTDPQRRALGPRAAQRRSHQRPEPGGAPLRGCRRARRHRARGRARAARDRLRAADHHDRRALLSRRCGGGLARPDPPRGAPSPQDGGRHDQGDVHGRFHDGRLGAVVRAVQPGRAGGARRRGAPTGQVDGRPRPRRRGHRAGRARRHRLRRPRLLHHRGGAQRVRSGPGR